jgi:TolB protein
MRVRSIKKIILGAVLAVGLMFVSTCDGILVRDCDRTAASGTSGKTGSSVRRPRGHPGTIAFISGHRLWTMREDGSAKRALTQKRFVRVDVAPAWSLDGSQIAFETHRRDYKSVVYAVNANGTGQRRIGLGGSPSWLPDGRVMASRCDRVCVMNADGTDRRRMALNGRSPVWSPDGRKIALVRGRNDSFGAAFWALYVMNADGTGVRRVTDYGGPVEPGAWSPDGRRFAFELGTVFDAEYYGDAEIWIASADGTSVRQLTDNDDFDLDPIWSPDGRQIAFVRGSPGASHVEDEIYVMDADGRNQRRLTCDSVPGHSPAWSPDGRKLAFVSGSDTAGEGTIYVVNADGSNQRQVAQNAFEPVWQPAPVRGR